MHEETKREEPKREETNISEKNINEKNSYNSDDSAYYESTSIDSDRANEEIKTEQNRYEPNFIMKDFATPTSTGSSGTPTMSTSPTSEAITGEASWTGGTLHAGFNNNGQWSNNQSSGTPDSAGSANSTDLTGSPTLSTSTDPIGSPTPAGPATPADKPTSASPANSTDQQQTEAPHQSTTTPTPANPLNPYKQLHNRHHKPPQTVTLTRKTLVILIALCVILSMIFGTGGAIIASNIADTTNHSNLTTDSTSGAIPQEGTSGYNLQDATGSNLTIQQITARAQSSVVEIKTESVAGDSWIQQYVTEGAGSGVIISKDGYIITNNHVIDDANKIMVTTHDEQTYEATVIGADATNDIAVIKIKASGLTPATYGNSDQLNVGDLAVAIGNPLGELGGTVTAGIISAKDRALSIDGKSMKLLQTDSSINPGNSGGGLFNGDGQLVGIVVAKSSGSDVEGLGFAIPINTAADVAEQLMDKGYVSGQPWTGMTYSEGSSGFDFMLGGSSDRTVYIYSVDTLTAQQAGFKPGDVVFAVEGTQISSIDDLSTIITSHQVGDKLKFTIVRDGKTKDITLKLQEKTKEQAQ